MSSSASSTTDSISTKQVQCFVDRLQLQGHRDFTRQNYHSVWKLFNEFFIKLDDKPNSWEDRLILFVGYLIQNDKKSSTVRSYVSAIKCVLLEDGIVMNENKYLLGSLTNACKLVNDQVRTRLPIKKQMLEIILNQTMDHYEQQLGQVYLSKLYRALFVSGYFRLLRVGEMTSGSHPVFATDVEISMNKKKVKFTLHTLKRHWRGAKPQIVTMCHRT